MADLTTLVNVKQWLNIATGVTGDDALLTRMIHAMSQMVISYTNLDFLSQTYSEVRDGVGSVRMMFADYPVTAVTLVQDSGVVIPLSADGVQPGYVFDALCVTLLGQYRFTRGKSNVRLNYTAGYTTTPYDLEQAVIETIGMRYKEKDRIGISSKTLATEVITFSLKDFSASAQTTLTQYRKVITV